jgi:glycosyltransferase involved in cell wall biosynthesis
MATVVGILDRDHWGANTDNIVVADPTTRTLTWIPRDLWCPSINHRINKAFAIGGIERLVAGLNELGFPCDQGLVLRRSATERAAMHISLEVPVKKEIHFWYPLHPTLPIHGPRKPVSFLPPSERLEGDRIHEWLGARKRLLHRSLRREGTNGKRMRRQQIFLRVLIEQNFDFSLLLADPKAVRLTGEEALRELAMIDASWRMQTFENVRQATINGMWVQLKENEPVSRDTAGADAPLLAVVVIALGAPIETVDAVRSLLEQKPPVEIVVVNTGGGGMAALLARHGIDVPVIEREERLYAGAARNIGIAATRAPYVAFLASDCRATKGWARKRLAAHRAGAAAVGCAMQNGDPHNPFAWAAHLALWSRRIPGASSGLPYGASYDRRLFEQRGYFREDLRVGEDSEFNRRLRKPPKWKGTIHTLHRNPTRFVPLIADQFRRGERAAYFKLEAWSVALPSNLSAWWRRTNRSLLASRQVSRKYRVAVWLARPLIPIAVAAYCLGVRSWQHKHKGVVSTKNPSAARVVQRETP